MKLPALYLLDSVAKNLRDKYASLLEAHVAELYTLVWEALPQSRRSLEHLRATWKAVFPAVRPASWASNAGAWSVEDNTHPARRRLPTPSVFASVRVWRLHVSVTPRAPRHPTREKAARLLRPTSTDINPPSLSPARQAFATLEQHFAAATQAQAQQQQAAAGWMPPGAAGVPTWAPPAVGVGALGWGPQVPPQHHLGATSSSAWYPAPPPSSSQGVMPSMVYGQHMAAPVQVSHQHPHHPLVGGHHTAGAPPVPFVPGGQHPSPHVLYGQQQAPLPHSHGDGTRPLLVPVMPSHHVMADGAWASHTAGGAYQQQAHGGGGGMPPSLASLLSDLAHSMATSGAGAQLSSGGVHPGALGPATPDARLSFDAQALRGRPHPRAVSALYADQPLQCPTTGRRFRDAASYAAHLELLGMLQRKEAEGNQVSRRWFVPFDTWASGAATVGADPDAAGAFFDAQEAAAVAKAAEAAKAAAQSMPVDEAQPRCALTGELFDTFWHAELEEWHYRGAVRLEKATGGVPAGRLVLTKAIPKLDGDAQKALLDSRAVALDLAAAAAGAGAAEVLPPPYEAQDAEEHGAKRQRTG